MSDEATTHQVGVRLERESLVHYVATNEQGVQVRVGHGEDVFSPVELLLAAVAACSSIDVDSVTSRRGDPDQFRVDVSGDVVKDPDRGNQVENVALDFHLRFSDTAEGRQASRLVERLVKLSHDKDCTVGRTLMRPTSLTSRVDGRDVG